MLDFYEFLMNCKKHLLYAYVLVTHQELLKLDWNVMLHMSNLPNITLLTPPTDYQLFRYSQKLLYECQKIPIIMLMMSKQCTLES